MKKTYLFLLLLLYSNCLFSFSDDIKKIKEKNEITVAMLKGDVFPFFMRVEKDNKFIGSDVKFAKEIGEHLNVKVIFKRDYNTYDEIIEGVFNHEADIGVSFLAKTVKRSQKVYFTTPYLKTHLALLVNRTLLSKEIDKEKTLIQNLDIKKHKIGVLKGSSYVFFGDDIFKKAQIVEYNSVSEEIKAVKNGEIVATLINEVELNEFIVVHPHISLNLKTILIDDYFEYIAIALASEYPHLKFWLDAFIEQKEKKEVLDLFHEYQDVIKQIAEKQELL